MSVKGIAGTTPAPSKVSHIRRESSTFSPPNTRPTSRLSDAGKDAPKVGKTSDPPSTTTRVTALGKSVRINSTVTTPPSITSNKVPTPTTIKPARTIESSMGPPPVRPRASLSTTTSPTGVSHARVSSTSSILGRSGTKSPPATTTAGSRRPTSMSGTELLRQAKLAAAVTKASTLSDVDRSTSKQSSTESGSDEKENTMRPSPRLTGSMSAASKRRSMLAVPSS